MQFAVAIQMGTVALLFLSLLMFGGRSRTPNLCPALATGYVFLVAALLSMMLSSIISAINYSAPYVVVMMFYVGILVVSIASRSEVAKGIPVPMVYAAISIVLIAVALAQQFAGFDVLPGIDDGTFHATGGLRPSSTTGSFLHFPIVLALLAFIMLEVGLAENRQLYKILACVNFVIVGVSASRSGILLSAAGLGVVLMRMRLAFVGRMRFVILASATALVVTSANLAPFVERVLSMGDPEGAGNATRINSWSHGISVWLASPILFGSHTGSYTNVTRNAGFDSTVVESGVIQQLVNFGLVGTIAFYGLLVLLYRRIQKDHIALRAAVVGAIMQSFFFQSIEVLPFMTTLALLPVVSDHLARAQPIAVHCDDWAATLLLPTRGFARPLMQHSLSPIGQRDL